MPTRLFLGILQAIMCGRAYETFTEEELWMRYANQQSRHGILSDFHPSYNLCPTQIAPVILLRNGAITIENMRWGLVPHWAKSVKDAAKYSLINCKAEEIEQKTSYKGPFRERRCLVPLSGFFEWKKQVNGPKRPFAIRMKNEAIMSVAGIYEHWVSKETGEIVDSFAVITTDANSLMSQIHNRMPVILNREMEAEWLNPADKDMQKLKSFLKPCPAEWLELFEVSNRVNSPQNNSAELIKPIAQTQENVP